MRLTVDINYVDEFKEAEHPRGQPENAGEFVAKGQGAAHRTPLLKPAASRQPARQLPGQAITREGKRVQADGAPLPSHIQALRIPPAWTDVRFAHDPHAALQVTGRDVKGKRQPIYHAQFTHSQSAIKFARIKELDAKFGSIVQQNNAMRKSHDPRVKDNADCAHLIMQTG